MPMTVPVGSSSGSDQPAVADEPAADPSYKNRWRRPHSVDRDPVRLTSSIFHPPRAS
jgi:hypothetical protein